MENLEDGFGFITSTSSLLPTRSHDLDILSLPCVGNETADNTQNTCLMLNIFFFENHAVYDIMRKKFVQRSRPQMAIRRMRIVC